MIVSLIIPTFDEQDNVKHLYERLNAVTASIKEDIFEFVFIDDCSTDKTPELLKELHLNDKRVKIIRFSRNCGSHAAITAGLHHVESDCSIILAADLQDPPEIIPQLMNEWKNGAKIVWGGEGQAQVDFLRYNVQTCYNSNSSTILINDQYS